VRSILVYRPDDLNDLLQQWPQKHYDAGIEHIEGYRFPAPGSRPEPNISTKSDDQFFEGGKYAHDPRNLRKEDFTYINGKANQHLIDEGSLPRAGSANRKPHAAISSYDPAGLRATITATWTELDKALAKNATPDHLPVYECEKDQEFIVSECIRKGIPIQEGRRLKTTAVSGEYNRVKW
jgi:hypothetical protein